MKKVGTNNEIAPWKIDSPIETWLSHMADNSSVWKRIYVQYYKLFDSEYYNKGIRFIDKNIELFVGNVSAKQRREFIVDMVYSLHRFGCMFDEYFLYGFPTLNTVGRDSFITDKIRWNYYSKMNVSECNELFNDKKKAYDMFGKFYRRELILICSEADKDVFVDFAKRHKEFIVKPYNGSGGRGVFKMSIEEEKIEECFSEVLSISGGAVLEELIIQSNAMSAFHASSVNTVRVPTIRDKEGVHLFHPLLRTGVGGGIIDNATGGGIFALVNAKNGVVYTEAKDEKGNTFLSHPNTGVVYPGYMLPDWDQAVELVSELAMVVKENHYVGWDLAHTDQGWIMVEGNPRGQLIMMQLFFHNGFKKEMEEYISRM